MAEEWRVEVELGDEQHHLSIGERLRSHDVDDDARKRLGDRVIVTRDGNKIFLYAKSAAEAGEAEKVVREEVAEEGLEAEIAVTRWHPVEEAWLDPSAEMPETDAEAEAERERHEQAAEQAGVQDWEVKVSLPSMRETRELADRLAGEGLPVRRRWRHLLIGTPTEDDAAELGKRIEAEAPEGSTVFVEPRGGVPHPLFVYFESHKPGSARDLGL
jgi:hypothetical protein